MSMGRRIRVRAALQNSVFVLLIVALAGLLAVVAREYRNLWDLTSSARNTLSQASRSTLAKIDGPVMVTAYATPQDARFGDIRKLIGDFIARYQRTKPDLRLEFIDPREQPKAAQAAGIQVNGELVIEFNGRREKLARLSEVEFTSALIRLVRSGERLVMTLEGHGERSLIGTANHDLGDFGKQLAAKGIAVSALNLSIAPEVPENAALLIISNPRTEILASELGKLERYVEAGGNLLLLLDQEPLYGLEPIVEKLGLILSPGIVVDPDSIERGGRPVLAVAAASSYSQHPLLRSFRLNTLFPFARALGTANLPGWQVTPLIEVAPRGWLETDSLSQRIVFDRDRDVAGPITIALGLERVVNDRQQRIVAVGSGHFLANTYLGNGGNSDLGANMVNWLIGDESLIAIQPRATPDAILSLSKGQLLAIVITFLIVVPVVLLSVGAMIWWRRRRV